MCGAVRCRGGSGTGFWDCRITVIAVLCADNIKGFHREGGPVEHIVHMRYPREEVYIEYNIELYYSLERRSK